MESDCKTFTEDVEIARMYAIEHPDRGSLGRVLEQNGMGVNHHLTGFKCESRVEYINLVLDQVLPE